MMYYRCKCGQCLAYGSMPPPLCSKCPTCGSDLASSPGAHGEPKDHDFSQVQKIETDQGSATITRCRYCGKKKPTGGAEDAQQAG